MHKSLFLLGFAALASSAAAMRPPREESPVPKQILNQIGLGTSDEELARAVAAADAHPLGTLANPVRVGGPEGARDYIAQLRCADGSAPKIGSEAAAGVGAFGTIASAYPLDCGAAAPGEFGLVMDLYHDGHVEERVPVGFQIERR